MRTDHVIEAEELSALLGDEHLVLFEVGFAMPGMIDGKQAYQDNLVIPGAQYFDIDRIADHRSLMPHTMPTASAFTVMMQAMGVNADSNIVVYDRQGLFAAGRAWWLLRSFGHLKVRLLNGGLRYWQQQGLSMAVPEVTNRLKGNFVSKMDSSAVVHIDQLKQAIADNGVTIVDARPALRFSGSESEPRPGMRSGHMPGARNLPFPFLTDPETGKLVDNVELNALFAEIPRQNRVYSCGSGVTACALMLAAHVIDQSGGAVYDGSWVEWGSRDDTPIVAGIE